MTNLLFTSNKYFLFIDIYNRYRYHLFFFKVNIINKIIDVKNE